MPLYEITVDVDYTCTVRRTYSVVATNPYEARAVALESAQEMTFNTGDGELDQTHACIVSVREVEDVP